MRWWTSHTRSPGSTSDSVGHHRRACATDASSNHRGSWTGADTVEVSSPSARCGLRGVRVGEASNQGPVECSTGATQPDTESDTSDTESVRHGPDFHTICTDVELSVRASAPIGGEQRYPCRRLTLRSGSQVVRDSQAVLPDSHDQRLERVRHRIRLDRRTRQGQSGEDFIRDLVTRVGPLGDDGNIPRVIRRQQWSIFNVPLMWSAAENVHDCPMLEWLSTTADQLPRINIGGEEMGGREAVQAGWRVRYSFIQIGMNLALFIPKIFIQNHFHPKTTLIQNHFHPKPLSSKTTFIPNHFHHKP